MMHPATRLAVWGAWMLMAFVAPPAGLPVLLLGFSLVCGTAVRRRFLFLAGRSRWLLLAILVAMSLAAPGEHWVPGYPGTKEGLWLAVVQAMRLLVALTAVAWLLDVPRPLLISGFRSAFGSGLVRSWGDVAALRIALVLIMIDDRRTHWRNLLGTEHDIPARTEVRIPRPRFTSGDRWLTAGAAAVGGLAAAWGVLQQ